MTTPRAVGFAAAGALLAIVGAGIYAAALVYDPNAYLGPFLPLLFGVALGSGTARIGARVGASATTISRATWAVTIAAYLLSWPPWEWLAYARLRQPVAALAVAFPPTFFALLQPLYEHGAWTLGGASAADAVSGARLGAVWLLEAVVVAVSSAVATRVTLLRRAAR